MVQSASTAEEYQTVAQHLQYSYPLLAAVLTQLGKTVTGATAAREELQRVVTQLRDIDIVMAGGHTRAADVLQLYASTQVGYCLRHSCDKVTAGACHRCACTAYIRVTLCCLCFDSEALTLSHGRPAVDVNRSAKHMICVLGCRCGSPPIVTTSASPLLLLSCMRR